MKNKILLAVIVFQSFLMLTLIYILWGKNNHGFFINENHLFLLTILTLISFFLGISIYLKFQDKYSEGIRRDGVVKWYNSNKGFGFIEHNQGEDIFVHQTEIRQSGFRYLNLGDHVEFEIGKGKKGPVALNVIRTMIVDSSDESTPSEETEESICT